MKKLLWGIDLGGTKIEGIVLDPNHKSVPLSRLRLPTEAHLGYEHILSQISILIHLLSKEVNAKPEAIGIGAPGMLEPIRQTIKNANTTILNGKPLKADLEKKLGVKVYLANDANCFALAETLIGAAQQANPEQEHIVFGVILGTGVGGGIVVNKHGVQGCHLIAGEWGHNELIANGKKCYCGKDGCVETVISGPALEQFYYELSGKKASLKEIYQAFQLTQEPKSKATILHLIKHFAKAIAMVINILDPHVVVIGGGVGNIGELYSQECKKEIEQYLFFDTLYTKIVPPKLGDSAGVFGAAFLAL